MSERGNLPVLAGLHDRLNGRARNDLLVDVDASCSMTGGAGRGTFRFSFGAWSGSSACHPPTIEDFELGTDRFTARDQLDPDWPKPPPDAALGARGDGVTVDLTGEDILLVEIVGGVGLTLDDIPIGPLDVYAGTPIRSGRTRTDVAGTGQERLSPVAPASGTTTVGDGLADSEVEGCDGADRDLAYPSRRLRPAPDPTPRNARFPCPGYRQRGATAPG